MAIPQVYKTAAEGAIASYNYTDIAEGTGIVTFYAARTQDSVASHSILTQNVVYSDIASTAVINNVGSDTWGKKIDWDFDLSPFNMPQTIGGKANISVSWQVTTPTSGTAEGYLLFLIKKNDSFIASVATITRGNTPVTTYEEKTSLLEVTVPKTHFKKGDVLRVTMEGWARSGAVSDGMLTVLHDPKARTINTFDTSVLQVNMPFDLDL